MCGLVALVDTPWQQSVEAALRPLMSRGPDATGFWRGQAAALGHARLSVIDLQGGSQPMSTEAARYQIVYNGEIYNFEALRESLRQLGHPFATRSDTEVILRGYLQWGRGVAARLDGMFAFVIWDQRARSLFAARDRLGIKPLFYSAERGLTVASTLAPFFELPGFPREIDYEALRDYLAFQTPLAPRTLLRAVRQLPPAHCLEWREGSLEITPYWSIPAPQEATAAEPLASLDAVLAQTVKEQLVADVPIGAFLSGGIDSSLVVHYMAQAQARPLMTFSVRFPDGEYDESAAAAAVARAYGTEHHVLEAPSIGAAELERALRALDQPLADPAYLPTFYLSQLARRSVKVVLSGDGGDELFGGYARFLDTEDLHPDTPAKRLLRALVGAGLAPGALLRRGLAGQELLLYRRTELGPWNATRKSLRRYLHDDFLAQARPQATLEGWLRAARSFGGRMDSAALMRADLWTYLSENCLVKTDRASMAHGLEVRVPLLGNAVADFALSQPAAAHLAGGATKRLLTSLARAKLPREVWDRPKHGFSVPLQENFNGAWRELCEHALSRARELAPFLRADALRSLWEAARRGRASRRLAYTFIVLLLWLDQHPLVAAERADAPY